MLDESLDDATDVVRASAMAFRPGTALVSGPSTVAVHDNGDMRRNVRLLGPRGGLTRGTQATFTFTQLWLKPPLPPLLLRL